MGELVRVDLDLLPAERRYRPMSKGAWYGRRIPGGLGIGAVAGIASVALHPLAMWAALLGVFGYSITRRRRLAAMARRNMDALAQLMAGELDDAGEAFESLCRDARGAPGLHSLAVCNRAAVFLEQGDAPRAAGLLSAVLHAGWVGPGGSLSAYYPAVMGKLAMAEALQGRLDQAQAWRTRAHAATSSAKHGMHLLSDAVVEARLGNDEAVIASISEGWARAENLHTARQLRQLRLLEAFALERLASSEYRGVSRETDAVRALDAARSAAPGEFRMLTTHWDELARFAALHGID
jgi:hypothetical protein